MLGISRVRLKVTASKLGSFSSLLQVKVDAYNGVTVTEDITSLSDEDFEDRLAFSMKSWKADSRKGVWLRLPITHSQLIPVAVEQDFWFHHAGEDYLLLCNWLQGGRSQSKLPPRASHYVGVSGFVLNSREEVLVIQEESGPASEMGLWKLPGGLVDSGESLEGGSVREVKEETGIDCEYGSLASIIEFHKSTGPSREQSSDLYCISVLTPLDDAQPLVPQLGEVAACSWKPVHDILGHPFYSADTAFGVAFRSALAVARTMQDSSTVAEEGGTVQAVVDTACAGLTSESFPLKFTRGKANVLFSRYISSDTSSSNSR